MTDTPRCVRASAVLLALLAVPCLAHAADPPAGKAPADKAPGDLWEVTTQMSMEGLPMQLPSRKQQICTPKEWKEPPAAADERQKCVNSEFKVNGPKATWKVKCAGPPESSVEGEIVRDGEAAYTGSIKLTAPEGNMNIKLAGKRLGACEPK
jgi:hypothetical protein